MDSERVARPIHNGTPAGCPCDVDADAATVRAIQDFTTYARQVLTSIIERGWRVPGIGCDAPNFVASVAEFVAKCHDPNCPTHGDGRANVISLADRRRGC
jgi:hypothetical protein